MFKSRKDIIGFDDRWILLFGVPVTALLINTLLFGHLLKDKEFAVFGSCFPISIYFTTLYWVIFRELYFFLVKKYHKYDDISKRQLIAIISIFIGYFVIDFMGYQILLLIFKFRMEDEIMPNPALKIITSVVFTFLIFVVYESFFLAKLLGKSISEKEKLITENIQSQLSGLQSQINPHFLFNSLNTLSTLIQEDPIRADKFVTKLAKVYRHILEQKEAGLVTIESELTYLRAYVHLLKERFGDNLVYTEDIDESILHQYILPFSLQITFENCVKHNTTTKEQPLHVKLYSESSGNYLCIENNISPILDKDVSTSVGLANIKRRYAFFTDDEVKVCNDGTMFQVCLPVLSSGHLNIDPS
jgi:two-component system, LytTR family, sensor kinase